MRNERDGPREGLGDPEGERNQRSGPRRYARIPGVS
jgi:hypothetical protein